MADHGEKPAFSPRQLDAAETAQRILEKAGKIGEGVIGLVTGSPAPAYIQVNWQKQADIQPSEIVTVKLEPPSHAHRWPRRWPAAVFGVDGALYQEERANIPEARPAVTFVSKDIVRMALLPEGVDFGIDQNGLRTCAARRGRSGALIFGMGLWLPSLGALLSPALYVVDPLVAQKELAGRYPGTPLV